MALEGSVQQIRCVCARGDGGVFLSSGTFIFSFDMLKDWRLRSLLFIENDVL